MTILNGKNYNDITVLEKKIQPSKQNARVKCIVEEYTFLGEASIGDTILLSKIPESATILSAKVFIPASLGTTGIFHLGLAAHVDKDGTAVALDDDSLVQSADGGGQAANKSDALGSVGLFKEIGLGGAQPYLYASEATDAATGLKIHVVIEYSLP